MPKEIEFEKNKVSVVVPVWEEENLGYFCNELLAVLNTLGKKFEIILVDDGSRDGTFRIMEEIHRSNNNVKLIKLTRNFGQHFAIFAGIQYARGEVVITSDADALRQLKYVPQFIQKTEEGYDIVFSWRKGYGRGFLNFVFISLLRPFFRARVHDFTCPFRAFKFSVAGAMREQGSINKAPAMVPAHKCAEINIGLIGDIKRKSGYSFSRKIKLAFLIVSQVVFGRSYLAPKNLLDKAIEKTLLG
jgi:glycosyltransferase involved in cell wall biosynthesis